MEVLSYATTPRQPPLTILARPTETARELSRNRLRCYVGLHSCSSRRVVPGIVRRGCRMGVEA